MSTANEALHALHSELQPRGFEVLGTVAADVYAAELAPELAHYRLPEVGRADALVAVVGNTRRLWPLFLEALESSALRDDPHPLDAYSRLHISAAARKVAAAQGVAQALRYSFELPPRGVAIQRLAVLAGVAEASPVGLCVHPDYGPWFSLRAAVVFDVAGPAARAASPTCSRCERKPCVPLRQRAIDASGVPAASITREHFAAHWRSWLAVRDACPIGQGYRYGEAQVRYHYVKDRSALRS